MSPMMAAMRAMRADPSVVDQKLTRRTLRRVAGFARAPRSLIAAFLLFVVAEAALVVVSPLLVKHLLDDDVIGAQRSFTSTLSSTVANTISVLVVGVAMIALSWQITLACVALFPLLLIASRWVGKQLSGLTRQQMDGNADLGNLMTER